MTLQDYTTDELRAELKRRATEARKAANVNRDRKAKYLYAEGTVIEVYNDSCGRKRPFSEWRFRVRIDDELRQWQTSRRCFFRTCGGNKSNDCEY